MIQNNTFKILFLAILLLSKQNATQNNYKNYKNLMNSKLANWPKRSKFQILFHKNNSYMTYIKGHWAKVSRSVPFFVCIQGFYIVICI